MTEIAGATAVHPAQAGVGIEPAKADSEPKAQADVNRESGNDHWAARTVEAYESRAAVAPPASIPTPIGADEKIGRIRRAVIPTIGIRTD